MFLASSLDATARHEVVISPVRVNLEACVLSWWLPADCSPILRSSWQSPAEHDAGEKWTMPNPPLRAPHCTGMSQFLLERQKTKQNNRWASWFEIIT